MKKIFSLIFAVILLISLSSCATPQVQNGEEKDTSVEGGFDNCVTEWTSLFCAYKFDRSTYEKENATFTLYFGASLDDRNFVTDFGEEPQDPIVVSLTNADSNAKIILHELLPDEIFVEEYDCDFDENKKMIYNHSEEVTIPQELLTGTKGCILIGIGQNAKTTPNHGHNTAWIYYTIENETVTFSADSGRWGVLNALRA